MERADAGCPKIKTFVAGLCVVCVLEAVAIAWLCFRAPTKTQSPAPPKQVTPEPEPFWNKWLSENRSRVEARAEATLDSWVKKNPVDSSQIEGAKVAKIQIASPFLLVTMMKDMVHTRAFFYILLEASSLEVVFQRRGPDDNINVLRKTPLGEPVIDAMAITPQTLQQKEVTAQGLLDKANKAMDAKLWPVAKSYLEVVVKKYPDTKAAEQAKKMLEPLDPALKMSEIIAAEEERILKATRQGELNRQWDEVIRQIKGEPSFVKYGKEMKEVTKHLEEAERQKARDAGGE